MCECLGTQVNITTNNTNNNTKQHTLHSLNLEPNLINLQFGESTSHTKEGASESWVMTAHTASVVVYMFYMSVSVPLYIVSEVCEQKEGSERVSIDIQCVCTLHLLTLFLKMTLLILFFHLPCSFPSAH